MGLALIYVRIHIFKCYDLSPKPNYMALKKQKFSQATGRVVTENTGFLPAAQLGLIDGRQAISVPSNKVSKARGTLAFCFRFNRCC